MLPLKFVLSMIEGFERIGPTKVYDLGERIIIAHRAGRFAQKALVIKFQMVTFDRFVCVEAK